MEFENVNRWDSIFYCFTPRLNKKKYRFASLYSVCRSIEFYVMLWILWIKALSYNVDDDDNLFKTIIGY